MKKIKDKNLKDVNIKLINDCSPIKGILNTIGHNSTEHDVQVELASSENEEQQQQQQQQ
mgnify:FL=1